MVNVNTNSTSSSKITQHSTPGSHIALAMCLQKFAINQSLSRYTIPLFASQVWAATLSSRLRLPRSHVLLLLPPSVRNTITTPIFRSFRRLCSTFSRNFHSFSLVPK